MLAERQESVKLSVPTLRYARRMYRQLASGLELGDYRRLAPFRQGWELKEILEH
jgi:hypothetical protein